MSDVQAGADWWLASDGKWYPPQPVAGTPPTPTVTEAPANATASWLTLGGAAVIVVGALLPWATVTSPFIGTINKAGTDGDGVITIVLAVIVAALAALSMKLVKRKAVIAALVLAVLIGVIAVIDMADVTSRFADIPTASASIGIGLWLTLLGAVAGLAGSVLQLRSRPGT